ncbi:mannose-1-phosphate guanyltransferase alpha-A-like isoform X2 [Anneissia japonica]|uniref:mannose-1-phosphate guanyltransferase alpha-A-like isoform X2 n=1 Tax=Anneissia japonica TaxID=1529436 RepID=UPI00142583B4|nr:mannose-1-phosphate guanyltransferase alpha-A-like isoform X2 [Anneissia japonica]
MLKAVILIGGPQKGTRFRPLSLELPKPLFPIAGFPIIYHHIEACCTVSEVKEILLIGFYQPSESLNRFIQSTQQQFKINIRYLQEYTSLGTAGGLYHFRDQILSGNPESFFVFNGDVCCDFPLSDMYNFHKNLPNGTKYTILATEATRKQSLNYGCLVENSETHEVLHYVEKPQTFVSTIINGGVYLLSPEIFEKIGQVFQSHQNEIFSYDSFTPAKDCIRFEQDIFTPLAGSGSLFVFKTQGFWSQIKSAGSAIYANRLYLGLYHRNHPEHLALNGDAKPKIIGDVYIHPKANVHPSATLGPNVTVGENVTICSGVRVRESILLPGATLHDHCCILNSIVGWNSVVGAWSRVEGTPSDPNPNNKHAKFDSDTLFNSDGRLNPSITILGHNVTVPDETVVLNSIVMPSKELGSSYKNEILL